MMCVGDPPPHPKQCLWIGLKKANFAALGTALYLPSAPAFAVSKQHTRNPFNAMSAILVNAEKDEQQGKPDPGLQHLSEINLTAEEEASYNSLCRGWVPGAIFFSCHA